MVYTKDLRHKMTLRLNDELYDYVSAQSDAFYTSPSEYIRQLIAQDKIAREKAQELLKGIGMDNKKIMEGFANGFDLKTDINNKL